MDSLVAAAAAQLGVESAEDDLAVTPGASE
jgi:hypothetical protein